MNKQTKPADAHPYLQTSLLDSEQAFWHEHQKKFPYRRSEPDENLISFQDRYFSTFKIFDQIQSDNSSIPTEKLILNFLTRRI
jgi:hypothetical protein